MRTQTMNLNAPVHSLHSRVVLAKGKSASTKLLALHLKLQNMGQKQINNHEVVVAVTTTVDPPVVHFRGK